MEYLQKRRLLLNRRNLELKNRLNEAINNIKKQQKFLYKKNNSSFEHYAVIKEQIIEFQARHYDIYKFHIEYYKKVIVNNYKVFQFLLTNNYSLTSFNRVCATKNLSKSNGSIVCI